MIVNRAEVEKFEKKLASAQKADLQKNIAIFNALYDEAVALGVFPLKDPLDGIEVDIKISRVVNHVPAAPDKDRKRAR
jgi:hypothetical protein